MHLHEQLFYLTEKSATWNPYPILLGVMIACWTSLLKAERFPAEMCVSGCLKEPNHIKDMSNEITFLAQMETCIPAKAERLKA